MDKGGLPGTAALGIALALALSGTDSASHLVGSLVPILFTADIGAVIAYRKYVEWRIIKMLLFPCGIGIFLGFGALDILPTTLLRKLVGLVLLVITLLNFYLENNEKEQSKVLPVALLSADTGEEKDKICSLMQDYVPSFCIGICIGFFTMVANLAGPLLVVYLLKCNLSKEHINGTRAWIFLILNVVKLPLQLYLGNLQARNASALLPYVLLATGKLRRGDAFVAHADASPYYRFCNMLCVNDGRYGVVRAVSDF